MIIFDVELPMYPIMSIKPEAKPTCSFSTRYESLEKNSHSGKLIKINAKPNVNAERLKNEYRLNNRNDKKKA